MFIADQHIEIWLIIYFELEKYWNWILANVFANVFALFVTSDVKDAESKLTKTNQRDEGCMKR